MTPTPRALALLTALALVAAAPPGALAVPPAQTTVESWAAAKALADTTLGVSAVCTADGRVWADLHADRLLVPASGAKLLTAAGALDLLPLDATWSTTAHGRLATDGATAGDLVLVGHGDPQLLPDRLAALADALVAAGLRRVTGDLLVVTGDFAAPALPPGYDLKVTDAAYRPSIAAAGSNYGAFRVVVKPARKVGAPPSVRVDPESAAVVIDNSATTEPGRSSADLTLTATARSDGRTALAVGGKIGLKAANVAVRKRVADPALFTGHVLSALLETRGVTVAGRVRVDPEGRDTSEPELARVDSPALPALVRDMNAHSNNSIAETLFMHLGRATPDGVATWRRATAALSAALTARGLAAGSFEIVNGSGLYEATRVTPRAMTALLLSFAGDDRRAHVFRDSLAVAGEPGTLEGRLRTAATRGLVRAKTGTLDRVTTISGYTPTASGCLLAFAIFVNDADTARMEALRREVDRLVLALARL